MSRRHRQNSYRGSGEDGDYRMQHDPEGKTRESYIGCGMGR